MVHNAFGKKWKIFRWKAAVPLVTIVVMIAVPLFFPFERVRVITEFILYTPERENVVDMIANDQLLGDSPGKNIKLPTRYRYLSCDGKIHIEKQTEEEATLRNLIEDDIYAIMKLNSKWYYVVTD